MDQASHMRISHRIKKDPRFLPPAHCTLCSTHLATGVQVWRLLGVALQGSEPQRELNTQRQAWFYR